MEGRRQKGRESLDDQRGIGHAQGYMKRRVLCNGKLRIKVRKVRHKAIPGKWCKSFSYRFNMCYKLLP